MSNQEKKVLFLLLLLTLNLPFACIHPQTLQRYSDRFAHWIIFFQLNSIEQINAILQWIVAPLSIPMLIHTAIDDNG